MNTEPTPDPLFLPSWQHSLSGNGLKIGEQLFHHATELYVWYVSSSWYPMNEGNNLAAVKETDHICNLLSKMKRIAEISFSRGEFLSSSEEEGITFQLKGVFQDLQVGKFQRENLFEELQWIFSILIMNNPKAKLVSLITELEYRFCINPPSDQPSEISKRCQELLNKVIQNINPHLKEMNTQAMIQELNHILEKEDANQPIEKALLSAIQPWIF